MRVDFGVVELKHEVIIYWSDEDAAFIAGIPELSGCTADGATKAKALAAADKVVRQWVETARELGREIPKPRGRLKYA
jgi:predicted RNase H-like HicB family nuclease